MTVPPGGLVGAIWSAMPLPPTDARARGVQVEGTNSWIVKTATSGFGLVLTGVERPVGAPSLRNLSLDYKQNLEFDRPAGGKTVVSRCLLMLLEPPFDTGVLAHIVDRLAENKPFW